MHDDSDFAAADPVADSLDELLRSALWPDDASDPLDRLLRLAQWPEPAAGSLPDVRQIARQARRKRTLALGGAAAAVLLLAAALWNLRNPAEDSPPGFAKTVVADALPPPIRRSGTARSGDRAMDGPRSISAAASPAPSVADDEPSQALPFGEVRLRMIRARNGGRATSKEEAAIDSLLARRIVEPDGDLEELAQPFLLRRAEFEQRLLGRFGTFVGEEEPAAIDLLGCLGGEASVPLVMHESLKPATHAAAVRALLRIADTPTLARLVRREWDAELREEILAALRSRDDKQEVVSVLITEGDQSCLDFRSDSWLRSHLF